MCPDLRLVRARGCVQNELIDDLTSSFVRVPFVTEQALESLYLLS